MGNGAYGVSGDGVGASHSTPNPVVYTGVLNGKAIIALAAGNEHTIILSSTGQVYGWYMLYICFSYF
jgi:alpha-tubulin suppressor-like RCC1 family protein